MIGQSSVNSYKAGPGKDLVQTFNNAGAVHLIAI